MSDFPKKERTGRLLPSAPEAEQALLGCIIALPDRTIDLCEDRGVTPDWFHCGGHPRIYDVLRRMHTAKMPIDLVTFAQTLSDQGMLAEVGGAAYVSELFTFTPQAAHAGHYLDIVAEKHAARRLYLTCMEIAGRVHDEQDRIGELVDEAQAEILALNRPDADAAQEHIRHIKTGVLEAVNAIEETYHTRGGVVGLRTGFHQLDRMTGGLRGPLLVIVAGRPAMGKSAFIWNVAESIAIGTGKPVLGFSLEMNIAELAGRMVCGRAGVNLQRVRDGFLSKQQMDEKMPAAVKAVAGAPIWIDETAGLSIQELRVRVRRFIKRWPETACVCVDYLQLMKSRSRRAQENRALEIAEISGGLKNLAKEINRPIIAAAQLNRENDGPKNPPKLSNLRESGSIEQDADWAILLHRRHYYTKDEEDRGKADADLAKQRNGPTGAIKLKFKDELARFENPDGQEFYSNDPAHRQQTEDDE